MAKLKYVFYLARDYCNERSADVHRVPCAFTVDHGGALYVTDDGLGSVWRRFLRRQTARHPDPHELGFRVA